MTRSFVSILFAIICIVSTGMAAPGSFETGPFDISFTLNDTNGFKIDADDPIDFDEFTGYAFKMESKAKYTSNGFTFPENSIVVMVQDYFEFTDVSNSGLRKELDYRLGFIWKGYEIKHSDFPIGGRPGVLEEVQPGRISENSYQDKPVYLAAYSPDGRGKYGRITVFFQSSYPRDITEAFLKSLNVTREGL